MQIVIALDYEAQFSAFFNFSRGVSIGSAEFLGRFRYGRVRVAAEWTLPRTLYNSKAATILLHMPTDAKMANSYFPLGALYNPVW